MSYRRENRLKNIAGFVGVFALIASSVSFIPSSLFACSCIPPRPVSEAFDGASAVFVGTVTDISPSSGGLSVTMQVNRSWKGVTTPAIEVSTARDSAACGFSFEQGKTYMVYTQAVKDNGEDGRGLAVSLCSRTHAIESEEIDINEDVIALGTSTLPLIEEEPHETVMQSNVPTIIVAFLALLAGISLIKVFNIKEEQPENKD